MPLVSATRQGDWKTVQILLDHHANINATDDYGDTPLMYASWLENTEMVEVLLKRGANLNAKDDHGETALFWICHPGESDRHDGLTPFTHYILDDAFRAMIACLLRHGASVNGRDSEGKTVMRRAQEQWRDKQLIQMLKQAGAKE